MSPKTISVHLSAISFLHKMQNFTDPTKVFLVQKLVAGAYKLRPSADMRLPITRSILFKLLDAAEIIYSGYAKILTQTMFNFAFHTYARVGEITATGPTQTRNVLQLDNITVVMANNQPHEVKVCFRHFKHNFLGRPHFIAFKRTSTRHCPVQLFARFLVWRGSQAGPLFCDMSGDVVSRYSFDAKLKACLRFCGLSSEFYKGHSFRIGAASYDAAQGVPDSQIRLRGRWKSDAFRKYIRTFTN